MLTPTREEGRNTSTEHVGRHVNRVYDYLFTHVSPCKNREGSFPVLRVQFTFLDLDVNIEDAHRTGVFRQYLGTPLHIQQILIVFLTNVNLR